MAGQDGDGQSEREEVAVGASKEDDEGGGEEEGDPLVEPFGLGLEREQEARAEAKGDPEEGMGIVKGGGEAEGDGEAPVDGERCEGEDEPAEVRGERGGVAGFVDERLEGVLREVAGEDLGGEGAGAGAFKELEGGDGEGRGEGDGPVSAVVEKEDGDEDDGLVGGEGGVQTKLHCGRAGSVILFLTLFYTAHG